MTKMRTFCHQISIVYSLVQDDGQEVVLESSQQLLMLKCSTLHMGHSGLQRNEVDQCSLGESLQSDILLRIDMLVLSVPQQCH